MKKFSKMNESVNLEFTGWEIKEIISILEKSTKLKVNLESIYFISSDGELYFDYEIKKSNKDVDSLFSPGFFFLMFIEFPNESDSPIINGVKNWNNIALSFDYQMDIYQKLSRSIQQFKNDFFIFINIDESSYSESRGEKLGQKLCIELIMKDQFELSTIINNI